MDSRRFQELLPTAYLVAAKRGVDKDEAQIGLIVRDLDALSDERNLAYLVASSRACLCKVVDVRRDVNNLGDVRFEVTYKETADGPELKAFTPYVFNYRFLTTVTDIWDRFDENGVNYWAGKEMELYFHDDPAHDLSHPNLPRGGDHSSKDDRSYIAYARETPILAAPSVRKACSRGQQRPCRPSSQTHVVRTFFD